MAGLPLETQRNIEADSFWCMSKLLDGIQVGTHTHAQCMQMNTLLSALPDILFLPCFGLDKLKDNYTFAQPGIQNKVKDLEELVSRIDSKLLLCQHRSGLLWYTWISG